MNDNRHDLPPILLTPHSPYRCGDTVTARWTLTNYGDADVADANLAFTLTDGLTFILERSHIPGVEPSDLPKVFGTPTTAAEGVAIPTLQPGASINATFAFKIGKVVEADSLWVQAMLTGSDEATFISPRCPVQVRLAPRISVPAPEVFTIKADNQHFGLRLVVANDGGVAESGVHVILPVPQGVDAAEPIVPADSTTSFDQKTRTVHVDLPPIGAYDRLEVGFQFRANNDLNGDLIEIVDVCVASPSSGTFHLDPIVAKLERSVDFSESRIIVEPGPYIEAGAVADISVYIHNGGRSNAKDLTLAIALPEELQYAQGSLSINGAPDARRDDLSAITLPVIRAHTATQVNLKAVVKAPARNHTDFQIKATLDGQFELPPCECSITSAPTFPLSENYVWVDSPLTIEPRSERSVMVKVMNTGTDESRQVRLRIDAPDLVINRAQVMRDGESKLANLIPILGKNGVPTSAIDIGVLPPQEEAIIELRVMAPETFKHGSRFQLTCMLRHDGQNEMDIGGVVFQGRSFPRISKDSAVKSQRMDNLRIGQLRNISVLLKNEGADVARNVFVLLDLPEALHIERVVGADLQNDRICFNEIPACATGEATVTLRVMSAGAGEGVLEIHPTVCGDRMSTVHLAPLVLTTASQSFLDEVQVDTEPDVEGNALKVILRFKNVGDGMADSVTVRSISLDGYVPLSTCVNGKLISDIKDASPLAYDLPLTAIAPGEEVSIQYVVRPKGSESFTPRFEIESIDQMPIEAVGAPYRPALRHIFMPQYLNPNKTARMHLPGGGYSDSGVPSLPPPGIDAEFRHVEVVPEGTKVEATPPSSQQTDETAIEADVIEEDTQKTVTPTFFRPPADAAAVEEPDVAAETMSHSAQGHGAKVQSDEVDEQEAIHTAEEPVSPSPVKPQITIVDDEGEVVVPKPTVTSSDPSTLPAGGPLRFGGREKATAPVTILHMDQARIDRVGSAIDLLFKHEIGWYRHIFAMRLLAPDSLLGVDIEVEDAFERMINSFGADFKLPMLRLTMPNFEPTPEWANMLENNDGIAAMDIVMHAIPEIIEDQRTIALPNLANTDIWGSVSSGNFDFFEKNEQATFHHLNALLPELIPDTSKAWPQLGEALKAYKEELSRNFRSVPYMGAKVHERLLAAHPDMDEKLRNLHLVIENEVAA